MGWETLALGVELCGEILFEGVFDLCEEFLLEFVGIECFYAAEQVEAFVKGLAHPVGVFDLQFLIGDLGGKGEPLLLVDFVGEHGEVWEDTLVSQVCGEGVACGEFHDAADTVVFVFGQFCTGVHPLVRVEGKECASVVTFAWRCGELVFGCDGAGLFVV